MNFYDRKAYRRSIITMYQKNCSFYQNQFVLLVFSTFCPSPCHRNKTLTLSCVDDPDWFLSLIMTQTGSCPLLWPRLGLVLYYDPNWVLSLMMTQTGSCILLWPRLGLVLYYDPNILKMTSSFSEFSLFWLILDCHCFLFYCSLISRNFRLSFFYNLDLYSLQIRAYFD